MVALLLALALGSLGMPLHARQASPATIEGAPVASAFEPEATDDAGTSAITAGLAQQAVVEAEAATVPDREDIEEAARTSAGTDARIAAAVVVALARAPAIPDVGVDVNASVVTLSGEVINDEQRERAARLAKGVQGVTEVDNQLQLSTDIGTRLDAAMQELKDRLSRWVGSLPLLLLAILVAIAGVWLGRFVGTHLPWLRVNGRNPYLHQLIARVVQFVITAIGLIMALDLLGATKLVGALLGSAGVIGLALGFAFRDIGENYIAGIMLSLRRPFAPGDLVDIDGKQGHVVSLSPRATILMTLEGNHLRLPNAMVFKAVILNYSANPKRRISVRTDIDAAESIAEAEACALQVVCALDGILEDPPARVLIKEYGSQGIVLEVQAWVDQTRTDFMKASSAMVRGIKGAFGKAGIEPTRTTQFVVNAGSVSTAAQPKHEVHPADADTARSDDIDQQLEQAQRDQADTNLIAHSRSREE